MIKFISKYISTFLVIISAVIFFTFKGINNPWDRPISADGLGYYAHLPAFFIYHDFSYSFLDKTGPLYCGQENGGTRRSIVAEYKNGINLNKYFIGVAILITPFFLMAHFLSILFGYPPDGFSDLYQLFAQIACFFYFWLACIVLEKILRKFSDNQSYIALTVFFVVMGTNLLHSVVHEPTYAHLYLFFLINIFIYASICYFENSVFSKKYFLAIVVSISFIAITRPQDISIIFLLPFLAQKMDFFLLGIKNLFKNWKFLIFTFFISFIIISTAFIDWYLQTGIFYYQTYQGEHFYFSNPQFINQLFSYRKGWFLYTPMVVFSFFGFYNLYINNKFMFYNLLLYILLIIYIISSWWCWHYASNFSQRAYVDFYALFAILILYLFQYTKNRFEFTGYLILASILVPINIVQDFQNMSGILPIRTTDKYIYWQKFLSLKKESIYNIPQEYIIENKPYFLSMEEEIKYGINSHTFTSEKAYNGNKSSKIDVNNQFSAGFRVPFPNVKENVQLHVKLTSAFYSTVVQNNSSIVFSIDSAEKNIGYIPFYLSSFCSQNNWERGTFGCDISKFIGRADNLTVYFWNKNNGETTYFDDMELKFLFVKKDFEFLKQ